MLVDFTAAGLATSSIILADRIVALDKGYAQPERADHPYAFNKTEVFPRFNAAFTPDDVLSIVFFVYNLAIDRSSVAQFSSDMKVLRFTHTYAAAGTYVAGLVVASFSVAIAKLPPPLIPLANKSLISFLPSLGGRPVAYLFSLQTAVQSITIFVACRR